MYKNTSFVKFFFICIPVFLLFILSCKDDDGNPNDDANSLVNIYENCCGTAALDAQLDTGSIYIPNVMTPNFDGINDILVIAAGDGIDQINSFEIKNSSDVTIFEQEDFLPNNPAFGWNGQNSDGNIQPGLYKYSIVVATVTGSLGFYNGSICSVLCEEADPMISNMEDCQFATQHNGLGGFDGTLPNLEEGCF